MNHSTNSSNTIYSKKAISTECNHKLPVKERVVRQGGNKGKKFYGCPLWPNQDCGYFSWEDDLVATNMEKCEIELVQKTEQIEQVEVKRKELEGKVMKLKNKRDKLIEANIELKKENSSLKFEAMKYARGEKYALLALLLSWLMFAIIMCKY